MHLPILRRPVRWATYLVALLLIFASYWMNRYFGVPELDQILYHLNVGVDGLIMTDPAISRRFVRWCLIAPALTLLLLFAAEHWFRNWSTQRQHAGRYLLALRFLPLLLLTGAVMHWLVQVSLLSHIFASYGVDYFGAHYVAPTRASLTERQPRNLVLIYVESLENSYALKAIASRNLLAPLARVGGASFANFRQAPGTGWTIAGIVASQCGVPLKRVTLLDGNTQGEALRSFLPNATCLSDILASHGYRNVFLGGASAGFAGKGKFLHEHAYQEVFGKEDWLRKGANPDKMNGWGLSDGDLFSKARIKLRELQDSHARFNLTVLTVNTHEPHGHLSDDCARRGFAGFEGVIECTAEDLANFITFIEDSGYLANTNVVVLGDHLARKNPLSERLQALPDRHIFNLFLSSDMPVKNTEDMVHFDMLPTILEFSGFSVDRGRLGLGYSGFNPHGELAPEHRFDDLQRSVMNRSETYLALWGQAPDAAATQPEVRTAAHAD